MRATKLILMGIIPAVLFTVSCGKDKNTNNNPETQPAITDLNTILQAGDRRELVGRSVDMDNVPVNDVTGTYVFWAGDTHSSIPVFRKDKLDGPVTEHVKKGGKCRLNGTIRLVDDVPAADPLWAHINAQEKSDIQNARVFISADKVQVIH